MTGILSAQPQSRFSFCWPPYPPGSQPWSRLQRASDFLRGKVYGTGVGKEALGQGTLPVTAAHSPGSPPGLRAPGLTLET